jgi:hypothetical protein
MRKSSGESVGGWHARKKKIGIAHEGLGALKELGRGF